MAEEMTYHLIERRWHECVLIEAPVRTPASNLIEQANAIPKEHWVSEVVRPGALTIEDARNSANWAYHLKSDQAYLCVQWDETYIAGETTNYSPCVGDTPDLKPTHRETYLPYGLVLAYGLEQSFRLIAHADPIHIYNVVDEYYTHEGERYLENRTRFLMSPDVLAIRKGKNDHHSA